MYNRTKPCDSCMHKTKPKSNWFIHSFEDSYGYEKNVRINM